MEALCFRTRLHLTSEIIKLFTGEPMCLVLVTAAFIDNKDAIVWYEKRVCVASMGTPVPWADVWKPGN